MNYVSLVILLLYVLFMVFFLKFALPTLFPKAEMPEYYKKHICRNVFCRKKKECPFYINNRLIIKSESDLEKILESNSSAVDDK